MYILNNSLSALLILLSITMPSRATESDTFKSAGMSIRIERLREGLGVIWGMTFIKPDQLLMTQRDGSLLRLDLTDDTVTDIKSTPEVLAQGQGGLLDVAVSPDYDTTGWIYFTYVKDIDIDSEGVTVLARAKLKNDALTDWKDLLITRSASDESQHFGSRITFDGAAHVYFGIGDRGIRGNSQDKDNHAGSIIRLNLDGTVPQDNPYVADSSLLPEVWSIGHRNPQGMAFDSTHQRLWSIEHGPRGGDELNLISKGANYGWPVITYGKEYWGPVSIGEGTHKEGMQQPVKVYTPSIAPSSLLLYTGDALPGWRGNLFAGALKIRHLNRLVISESGEVIKEERLLENLDERIRALAQSPQGWLYFSTDSGSAYRLSQVE